MWNKKHFSSFLKCFQLPKVGLGLRVYLWFIYVNLIKSAFLVFGLFVQFCWNLKRISFFLFCAILFNPGINWIWSFKNRCFCSRSLGKSWNLVLEIYWPPCIHSSFTHRKKFTIEDLILNESDSGIFL